MGHIGHNVKLLDVLATTDSEQDRTTTENGGVALTAQGQESACD